MSSYKWPSDETLLKLILDSGSISAASRRLQIPQSTLSKHVLRQNLSNRIAEAKRYKLKANPANARKLDPVEPLQQELREARKALAASHTEDIRESRVVASVRAAVEARAPLYKPAPRRPGRKHRHSFVLLWSDAHAGEVVEPGAIGDMNSYNWEVMLARHQELFAAVASYVEHRNYGIEALHVAALGDCLSGNIHDELKETNSMPLAEATVQFGLDAADWLEQFVELVPRITFTGVVGNHARESQKPQAKRKYSNADWTCYQIMRQRLSKQEAIRFDIPKSARQAIDVYGRTLLLFHGDQVGPSAMVGVPWGGIVRHVARLRNQYTGMGLSIDHFLCGHFHEANVVSARRIIVNGSVVGASEYSLEKFGESSLPEQILLTFNRNHGLVDVSYLQLKAGLP